MNTLKIGDRIVMDMSHREGVIIATDGKADGSIKIKFDGFLSGEGWWPRSMVFKIITTPTNN